jgi:hypothetical protein
MIHTKRLRYLINVLQKTFGDKNNQVQEFFTASTFEMNRAQAAA